MAINHTILNLQSHYDVIASENGYKFETVHGNAYELSFLIYPTINESQAFSIYTFNIERIHCKSTARDHRIRLTIEHVLKLFFSKNSNALLAVLDTTDSKAEARLKLFSRWFEKSENTLEKMEHKCTTDDLTIYSIIYFDKNNKHKELIIEAYNDLIEQSFYC